MSLRVSDGDTIAAIATPPGEGGLGVVRVSGSAALAAADAVFACAGGESLAAQPGYTARFGYVVSAKGTAAQRVIDEAIALVLRAPRSYTCEDTVEFSAHGGPAVLQAILSELLGAGARAAEPGEFTKRAFLNGRLDLVQAEAVLDLIHARNERSRAIACAQLEGALSRRLGVVKNELVGVLSHLEASIDFPDDFPEPDGPDAIASRLERAAASLAESLAGAELAFLAKRGLSVAICGKPNVGKSSLMNRLVRRSRVIVTPYAGTTRDVVEDEAQIGGFPVRFQDTAGIRESDDPIEREGIERSRRALEAADLALCVLDASAPLDDEDRSLAERVGAREAIFVLNKSDLPSAVDAASAKRWANGRPVVHSDCMTERGIASLETEIFAFITSRGRSASLEEGVVTTARQRDLVGRAAEDLRRATEASRRADSPELVAADVRLALDRIGGVVGEVPTDEILDAIFSQFCIGK